MALWFGFPRCVVYHNPDFHVNSRKRAVRQQYKKSRKTAESSPGRVPVLVVQNTANSNVVALLLGFPRCVVYRNPDFHPHICRLLDGAVPPDKVQGFSPFSFPCLSLLAAQIIQQFVRRRP